MIPRWFALLVFVTLISARPGRTQSATTVGFTVTAIESGTGNVLPVRIHLKDRDGRPVQPEGFPYHADHFTIPGTAQLALVPGTYKYEAEHGPEYTRAAGAFEVPADPQAPRTPLQLSLERQSDLAGEGWWSGDLHIHRPLEDIALLMRAEDLHVAPVITWWNDRNLWSGKTLPAEVVVHLDSTHTYTVMAGEDERAGGALLYFHLAEPLAIAGSAREYPSPLKYARMADEKDANVWIDVEKPFWWDVPTWVATGRVDSIGIANNHMTRAGRFTPRDRADWTEEAWGKARDYDRLPPPHGNGYWSQEIYYQILNCGIRLPPSAGSASGVLPNPVGYNRVWVYLGKQYDYARWWEGLRGGRCFVSNGPLLRVTAGGKWPGHVFRADRSGTLRIELAALLDGRDPIRAVEIIVNGRVHRSVSGDEFRKSRGRLGELSFSESGWFLVRAMADNDQTFRFASTAPWYVEIGDHPHRISRAAAQFFVDWVRERQTHIALDDPAQREEVLAPHREAEAFWQAKLTAANAE